MIPTYAQWSDAFRTHLGDTEVSGGQIWTDASGKCDPYLQQAYSELFKGFEGAATRNIIRTVHGNLPAYTSYIRPATFGATSFSEPCEQPLWERAATNSVAITNAVSNTSTPGTPFVRITAAAHGFSTGNMVLVFGVGGLSDDVNDEWCVVVQDANTFDLMGSTATGTYSSGGTATNSSQDWSEVRPLVDMQFPTAPSGSLGYYAWTNGAFRVVPSTDIRQVRMQFYLSGQAPTHSTLNATLNFDDALGFLAYRGAALATLDRVGRSAKFVELNTIALGPTQSHTDWGGLYGQLMRSKARGAARNSIVLQPFRNPRRNAGWANRY